MKSMQNHGFTSFDVLTLVFSLVVILAISGPIVTKNMQSGKISQAQKELESIAQSLIQYKPMKTLGFSNRGIASVVAGDEKMGPLSVVRKSLWNGEAGNDPWGVPYQYVFLRDSKDAPKKLIVWSAGPDHTNDSYKDVEPGTTVEKPNVFQGDDLGSVFPVE